MLQAEALLCPQWPVPPCASLGWVSTYALISGARDAKQKNGRDLREQPGQTGGAPQKRQVCLQPLVLRLWQLWNRVLGGRGGIENWKLDARDCGIWHA